MFDACVFDLWSLPERTSIRTSNLFNFARWFRVFTKLEREWSHLSPEYINDISLLVHLHLPLFHRDFVILPLDSGYSRKRECRHQIS